MPAADADMAIPAAPATRLSGREIAAYGALGLPLAFAALPVYVYAPRFYAGLGLSLGAAGMVLLAARVADAAIDPWLGVLSDRARNPARFVAAALLPLTLGMLALFNPPAGAPAALWLILSLTVVTLGFSAANIAYLAWGARLGDASQRTPVAATREAFGLCGVVLASLLPQAFAPTIEAGLPATIWVFCGLVALAGAATLMAAPAGGRVTVPTARVGQARIGPFATLASRRFRALLGVFALNGIAAAIPATLFLFFVADVLRLEHHSGMFLGLYFICAALALPVWVGLAARVGKRRAWLASMGLAVLSFAGAFFLTAGDGLAFAVIAAASGAALGADLALPPALLADVVAADQAGTAAGAYFGVWTLVTKLNLALAAGLALPALDWLGYRPGIAGTQAALSLAYCLLPCALKCVAMALLVRLDR